MSPPTPRPRLLGMTTSAFDPASRFRFVQFIPHLERAGWDVVHRPNVPDRQWKSPLKGRVARALDHRAARLLMKWNRWRDVRSAGKFDAVFVNRDLAGRGTLFGSLLVRQNPRFVFDFDDAIYIGRNEEGIAAMCRSAAWVTPGNRYLAEYAARHNSRYTVIPTVIDTEIYQPGRGEPNSVVQVGWSGSDQSIGYGLIPNLPFLRELQQELDFELVVITNTKPRLPDTGLRWRFAPWTAETEVAVLRGLDVGIMPLKDEPFERGKCGLKALQYMAVGKPVVASPVGVNQEIILAGQTGFLPATPGEWSDSLRSLVSSAERRREFGAAGRQRCEREYSVSRWLPELVRILEEVRWRR